MILLLSPAKTLDLSPSKLQLHSIPRMLTDSDKLVGILKKKSARSLKKLMGVSDNIAELNVDRFQNYSTPFNLDNAKQAILAFKGDVYIGLEAATFSEEDFQFAQNHLRILSGLYGLLTPLDLMQAYRLEMGTKLKAGRKKNLYEFWDSKITELVNSDLEQTGGNTILNLASKEYFHAIKPAKLNGKLVNVHFYENRKGVYKVISFSAKKARGAMANRIIKSKITKVENIKSIVVDDYVFNPEKSDDSNYVFCKE